MDYLPYLESFDFNKEVIRFMRIRHSDHIDDVVQEARIRSYKWLLTSWDGRNPVPYFRKTCFSTVKDFYKKARNREITFTEFQGFHPEYGITDLPLFEDIERRVASATPQLSFDIINTLIQIEPIVKSDEKLRMLIASGNSFKEYVDLGGVDNHLPFQRLREKLIVLAQ